MKIADRHRKMGKDTTHEMEKAVSIGRLGVSESQPLGTCFRTQLSSF
jgi:hypothetical protein